MAARPGTAPLPGSCTFAGRAFGGSLSHPVRRPIGAVVLTYQGAAGPEALQQLRSPLAVCPLVPWRAFYSV